MNILTEARLALVARLQTITVANGYRTNAGMNVRTGWFSEVLVSDDVSFPLICLQKGKGLDPDSGPGALKASPGFSVIGAVDAGLDDYDDALDDIELDIIQCLIPPGQGRFPKWVPTGVTGMKIGASDHFPPGNGERVASVLVPIHLHTLIEAK
jgi:hypothetical protein